MSLQTIYFVKTVNTAVYAVPHWWDRPRWWLVKLLGGDNPNDMVKSTRIRFDDRDFMEQLWIQKRYLYEHFNREPKTLLIGAEDFENMMELPTIQQAMRFDASFAFYGLTVKVIPWMRGALVMP